VPPEPDPEGFGCIVVTRSGKDLARCNRLPAGEDRYRCFETWGATYR
jgi:hypothetical protein